MAKAAIQDNFENFHKHNPAFYKKLVELSFQVKAAGFRRYSINALFERLRWHYTVDLLSSLQFPSNTYRSRYARLIMETEPDLKNFFSIKPLRRK